MRSGCTENAATFYLCFGTYGMSNFLKLHIQYSFIIFVLLSHKSMAYLLLRY